MSAISRRTLTDQVSDALLKIITDEELSTGDPLPPAGVLAKRFDVSNVVVREAVAQLAGLGVLSRRQGREPVVALPGSEILAEILTLHGRQENIPQSDFLVCRAALEVEAAGLAALRGNAVERSAALEPRLAALENAEARESIVEADFSLHLAIVELSGNRALKVILMSLVDVISSDISQRTHGEDQPHRVASFQHHKAVVQAIVDGDVGRARRSMTEHFEVALTGPADIGS